MGYVSSTQERNDAYNNGKTAQAAGLPRTANPYGYSQAELVGEWRSGWESGAKGDTRKLQGHASY
jgi:hypothetical protein